MVLGGGDAGDNFATTVTERSEVDEVKKKLCGVRTLPLSGCGKKAVPSSSMWGGRGRCEIGAGSFVGPFTEIQKGARLGRRTRVQSHSFVPRQRRGGGGTVKSMQFGVLSSLSK